LLEEEEQEDHLSTAGDLKKQENKKMQEDKRDSYDGDERSSIIKNEDEADEDETLELDMDCVVDILKDFHKRREDRGKNAELLGNPRMRKRAKFETEEQKKERIKREEKIFWEKMTTVLND